MGKGGSSVQQRPRAVITLGPPPNVREREEYIMKQQRWLLFMRHCAKCQQDEEECPFKRSCRVGKGLWEHILGCADSRCQYPRCVSTKDLLKHHQKCNVSKLWVGLA
jgi:E1A/CREB-binding protein